LWSLTVPQISELPLNDDQRFFIGQIQTQVGEHPWFIEAQKRFVVGINSVFLN
jgi:hypothetical protein